ncbi:MAG: AsnC family transcriptional regulator [Myxococcota bacterium]
MAENQWTFLTNHCHVLVMVYREPRARLRDIADVVGITERAAHRIICELKSAGYLEVVKEGRRNRYEIRGDLPLRHPLEARHSARELVELLSDDGLIGPILEKASGA